MPTKAIILPLLLVLVSCRTGTLVNGPSLPVTACGMGAAQISDWDLGKIDSESLAFFELLSRKLHVTVPVLLGKLADSYVKRGYSLEEFNLVLRALKELVASQVPPGHLAVTALMEREPVVPGNWGTEPLIAYVDPTCDLCQREVDVILKLVRQCPEFAPPVAIRVVSSDETSREAAAVLWAIKQRSPDLYIDACLEFLSVLSHEPAQLPNLASNYLGAGYALADEYKAGMLAASRYASIYPASMEDVPITMFRGIIIKKHSYGSRSFNPLHDHETLSLSLMLIAAYAEERVERP